MTKVNIDAAGMKELLEQAHRIGTKSHWMDLAMEWIETAEGVGAVLIQDINKLKKMAKPAEWSSTDGFGRPTCPYCHGYRFDVTDVAPGSEIPAGHKENCEFDELVNGK